MKTFENRELQSTEHRSHPWTTTTDGEPNRYYDLRARPDLIPTVLEDFRPFAAHGAVQTFYALLTWLNGAQSPFESNDCAFTGPEANDDDAFAKRLRCSGRLGLLFRDLPLNTREGEVTRLIRGIHVQLSDLEPDLVSGAVGTTRLSVDYLALPAGASAGAQVLISFWAWGDDEPEVFAHLDRVFAALHDALLRVGRGTTRWRAAS